MIVDASVWIAYFILKDKFHAETVSWLENLVPNETLVAPLLVLPEVAGAVTRRSQDTALGRDSGQALLVWPSLRLAPISDDLMFHATDIAASLAIKGPDAVYVATALMEGMPLVTWDIEQRTRGGRVVTTYSPAEVPR